MRSFALPFIACALALAATGPASAQLRLDIGATALKQIDQSNEHHLSRNTEGFLHELPFLPIPEADVFYQKDYGLLGLGLGVRAFTVAAESLAWPEVLAELDFGKWTIEVQAGGGALLMLGIRTEAILGQALIPDISTWLKLGKTGEFRLGVGAAGLYVPAILGDDMSIVLYLGGKASLLL
jgi:hypothetical protein